MPSFAFGSRRARLSWLAVGGLVSGGFLGCAESEGSALPHDPDYVAGSSGMAGGGTAPISGSTGNVSGSTSGGGTTSAGGGGAASTSAGTGGSAAGGAGAGGTGGAAGAGGAGGSGGADGCPTDPAKTEPGKCGCGVPDADSAQAASCLALQTSLVHRYSFDTDAKDSVGIAHGTLKNGATVSNKALTLSGGVGGGYLDLPNGIISPLTNATIEAWVTWTGTAGGDWQRVFDFGSSDAAEDTPGSGNKYLFLSARKFRSAYTSATPPAEVIADPTMEFPTTLTQVAVVVGDTDNILSVYVGGDVVASAVLSLPLSAINDVNNWIGRSQFASDEGFQGSITEFRIYNAALTGPQLKAAFKMGEDTTYLKK